MRLTTTSRPLAEPTVAAVYGAMVTGTSPKAALDRVLAILPASFPRPSFVEGLERLVVAP